MNLQSNLLMVIFCSNRAIVVKGHQVICRTTYAVEAHNYKFPQVFSNYVRPN